MKALSENEVKAALLDLHPWELADGMIVREFEFPDFKEAMTFVNQVAELAEGQNHHPDFDIRYNKVRVAMMTHDANGITKRDLTLAGLINGLESPDGAL